MHIACWSDRTSQDSPFTPNSAVRSESRQVASMQINTEEKNPAGEEKNVPAEKLNNSGTSLNTEHCDPFVEFGTVPTPFKGNHPDKGSHLIIDLNRTPEETAELIKDLMAESAKGSHIKSLNFDLGARDESSAGRESATAHMGTDGVVVQETNVGLACDLTTPMQQASNNYISLAEDTLAPRTTPSRKSPPEEKPKENPTAKRKYVRRKALNNSSALPTEVTGSSINFDVGASDENPVGRKNATVPLSKDISLVTHEPNIGLPSDLKTAMEQASNNDMPLPEEAQDPSKGSPLAAHPKEKPTCKRKYERKKRVNKYSTPPTEITEGLNELLMPGLNKMSRRKSSNFDVSAGEESSVGGENLNGCISKEKSVVAEKRHADLAYDQSTFYLSLPAETQASTTSPSIGNSLGTQPKEKTTGKRIYARRKRLKTSALAAEMTTELTEGNACRRSLNFDIGATNDSSMCRENLNVHITKENDVVVKETHIGLACDQNTCMNQAPYKCKSLPEDAKAPGISSSKGNSSGRKLNANASFVENKINRNDQAAAQDGHENSANILSKSVAKSNPNGSASQMVGSKRKHSSFPKHPDTHGINLFGAHYNESHWTTVKLRCPQEDAQGHPYASYSNFLSFNPESTQTYEEFVLHLRRLKLMMERIGSPTPVCDCASLTRRPLKCIDATVADTHASLTRKKQNEKISVLSSSADSSTNEYEMQQHHNFGLGPLGKSLDVAHDVHYVDALAEAFRQLGMNTEARDCFTQASTTSPSKDNSLGTQPKEKTTGKRMYARRKRLKTSSLTAEMTTEVTEALMPESTKMSCRRSLNFDIGATNDSSMCRENLNVHITKENDVVVKETHMGLACDQNTCMNQAAYKYKSLPEDTKAPGISSSKGNSSGRKLNANANLVENKINRNDQAAAQDGHENSANILSKSVAKSNPNGSASQMVGSKEKHSGFPKHPDTRGINLFGAHYNESKWGTVKLRCPQEDARGQPYASNSNFWSFNSGRTQTYEEFVLNLRSQMMLRIGSPTPLGKSLDIAHDVHYVGALAEQFRQLNMNTEAGDRFT